MIEITYRAGFFNDVILTNTYETEHQAILFLSQLTLQRKPILGVKTINHG